MRVAHRMPKPDTAPYGSWRSPITSDLIVARLLGVPLFDLPERSRVPLAARSQLKIAMLERKEREQ
jgi:hypothetical protein